MLKPQIEWVDRYPLRGVPGSFAVFISKHSDGSYHGAVFHYTKAGSWSKGQEVELSFDARFEIGNTQSEVLDACLAWSESQFGPALSLGDAERVQHASR